MSKISEEVKDIAAKIGLFVLQESDGDYGKACEEVTRLRINRLDIEEEGTARKLTIETSRPGLLIGKRGKRIEALQEYLGIHLCIVETQEHILDYIYPYDPMDSE
jgi:hypothetical protein